MFFIYTHKNFSISDNYRKVINKFNIVSSNNIICNNYKINLYNDVTDMSILQPSLCESNGQYYVYKNIEKFNDDIIGFLTYRRLMSPIIYELYEDILKQYDFICIDNDIYEHTAKMTVKDDFNYFHNINDLLQCCDIAQSQYNISSDIINKFLNTNVNYHFNIYITHKEIFIKYSEFVFNILKQFCENNHICNMNDVSNYINMNKKYYNYNGYYDLNSQLRLLGFLHEFLLQLFIMNNNYKVFGTYYIMR